MREMHSIMYENVPCWYELSWRSNRTAIVLKVRRDFVEYITKALNITKDGTPLAQTLKIRLGLNKVDSDFSGRFGFDDVFEPAKYDGEFYSFLIKLPCVKQYTKYPCMLCATRGEVDRRCPNCGGNGKEFEYATEPLYAVSASLRFFSAIANNDYPFSEFATNSHKAQLLTFNLAAERSMNGAHIVGEYSLNTVNWFFSLSKDLEKRKELTDRISKAMFSAHKKIHGGVRKYDIHDVRANLYEDGGLHLNVPGSACGIDPSNPIKEKDEGYEFSGHNIDSPMQQLVIIAGLAALHDEARKAGC